MNNQQKTAFALLEASANSDLPDQVEDAVNSAFQAGLHLDFVPPLTLLLSLDWHSRHEDIVGALQELRDARAVASLSAIALKKFQYLDYDEFRGLGRKCTWALADIGTLEARLELQKLAASRDALVSEYAQKRLDAWHNELHRKKGHQSAGED